MKRPTQALALLGAATLACSLSALGCGDKKKTDAQSTEAAKPPPPPPVKVADFGAICSGGQPPAGGAAYAPKPGAVIPVAVFAKSENGKFEDTLGPAPWTETENAAKVQLVACMDEKYPEVLSGFGCNYDGMRIEKVARTGTVRVYEATTGKKVSETEVVVPPPYTGCDFSVRADRSKTETRSLVAAFAIALSKIEPAETPAQLGAKDLWIACDGVPVPGAAKMSTEAGSTNAYIEFAKTPPWFEKAPDRAYWEYRPVTFPYYSFRAKAFEPKDPSTAKKTDADAGVDQPAANPLPALVVCLERRRGDRVDSCEFTGGKSLPIHAATWDYKIVEAATAKVLAEKRFEGKKGDCPFSWEFSQSTTFDAFPEEKVTEREAMLGAFREPTAKKK